MSPIAAVRLVSWGNAWLTGSVALDDVVDGVRGPDVSHTFAFPDDLSAGGPPDAVPLTPAALDRPTPDPAEQRTVSRSRGAAVAEALPTALAMGELRRRGTRALHLALPVPGDPLGVAGPPATTALVVEAGQGVVAVGAGLALVPELVGAGVQWTAVPAAAPPVVTSRSEAERALNEELLAAARDLAALDVARWNPGLPAALAGAAPGRTAAQLPPPLDSRRTGLLDRATRLRLALELALAEEGGARTITESRRRRELLEPLERTVRRAIVAACDPDPSAG